MAEADEVAVTGAVSYSVSSLASALDFQSERNKVVVSDFEFPTIGQNWHAQEARGAQVVHVHNAGNSIPTERFADAIDERTKLVAITHVCYRNGVMLDVPAIIEIAHSKGALVLLDAYQSLGTLPIDVKQLNVDFLVGRRAEISAVLFGPSLSLCAQGSAAHAESNRGWLVYPGQHLCDG